MPLAKWIDESGVTAFEPHVVLHSIDGPKLIRIHTQGASTWGEWRGQRTQRFIAAFSPAWSLDGREATADHLPVWRLIQPGGYTLEFWRGQSIPGETAPSGTIWNPESAQAGRLLRRIDAAGNVWQFVYDEYHHDGGSGLEILDSRPIGIRFLRAPADGSTDLVPMAELQLDWDGREDVVLPAGGTAPNENYGRLREARVVRFENGASVPTIVTQRVLYTYFDVNYAGSGQPLSADLGSAGDLIQVTKLTRLDGDNPDDELWRTQITQYRYHTGTYIASAPLDLSQADPWALHGHQHALKAVLYPDQVERFAYTRSGSSSIEYIGDAARSLLAMDDQAGNPSGARVGRQTDYQVRACLRRASVDYDRPFRVREQILLEDCGCGGSSSGVTRLTYDYFDYRDVLPASFNGEIAWSVHETEWHLDDTVWRPDQDTLRLCAAQSERRAAAPSAPGTRCADR
ncbi:MAG: hypothetical protein ACFHWZ_14890 [Phycisphaerales bacterium]